jgi:integrase
MATDFLHPYSVKKQTSGLWRVSGTLEGARLRRHFTNEGEAHAFCDDKNAGAGARAQAVNYHQTRLDADALAACEAGVVLVAGRWPLHDVFAAGVGALITARPAGEMAPLLEEWLLLVQHEVSDLRLTELRKCCRRFVRLSSGATTGEFTRQAVRDYLDAQAWAPTTKRNNRNALHRWADWLIQKGYFAVNPCSGVRVRRGRAEQGLPSILSPEQAAAFMRTTETAECRRLKGWAALCLFCGLRPSEAFRLTWPEVSIGTRELTVMGRKRGSKPRVVKLGPTAVAWLKAVKEDGEPRPGYYTRRLFRMAVDASGLDWHEDILRHSYASYTSAGGTPIGELAEQMGNSPGTLYAHYRTPRTAAQVKVFWEIRPAHLRPSIRQSRRA